MLQVLVFFKTLVIRKTIIENCSSHVFDPFFCYSLPHASRIGGYQFALRGLGSKLAPVQSSATFELAKQNFRVFFGARKYCQNWAIGCAAG